jgi:DNA-binding transcriptional regulator PaaX
MDVPPHTLRRLAKAGVIRPHRTHDRSWYTFSEARLARYAERLGFSRVSYDT